MKKFLFVSALLAAGMVAQAQFFVGGNLDLSLNSSQSKQGETVYKNPGTFGFGIAPNVGYIINDNLLAGIRFGVTGLLNTIWGLDGSVSSKTNFLTWDVNPYVRYQLFDLNKFGIWAEGNVSVGGERVTNKTTKVKGDPTTTFGVSVLPVLTYALTDHLTLEATLDFISLGYAGAVQKTSIDTNSSNRFGLNVSNNNTTVGIGFTYAF